MKPIVSIFGVALLASSSVVLAQGIDLGIGGGVDVDVTVPGIPGVVPGGQIGLQGGAQGQTGAQNQPITVGSFVQTRVLSQLHTGELRRTNVRDSAGNNIGTIDDLVINADGRVSAALVNVGGFLGIGARTVAIPWTSLQFSRELVNGQATGDFLVRSEVTRSQLENAPTFDNSPVANAQLNAQGQTLATGENFVTVRALSQLHTRELRDTNVRDSAGNNIGTVSDAVIDANGRVFAVLVNVGGFLGIGARTVAISWNSLQISREVVDGQATGDFVLRTNITREQLEGAPTYNETPVVPVPGPMTN